jgi:hypothetical protein
VIFSASKDQYEQLEKKRLSLNNQVKNINENNTKLNTIRNYGKNFSDSESCKEA